MKDIDDSAINFLEGTGQDERIPERWTPEHVGTRIVDAIRIERRLPPVRGPRPPGNHFREVVNEGIDQTDFADPPRNRRGPATATEIKQMEIALGWMTLLRDHDPGLAVVTVHWAFAVVSGKTVRDLCKRKGWAFGTFYRKRNAALGFVADHLNAVAVPVF
ncbi:hypothetical protein [Beijerinckia indica]|uniref:Uncharacterized protein n=1 Tax=Beijerinckia indica subsp. indica (strain ATCC 9039 / DSM 1715 / NCIMB 8712) TaxID=395963 RepID=B2ICD6_BEII9|nr:hypothetical protein [Beijerinckia indica]ACB96733.1 conserved hypothetical protein [Beijerinckia indica subsp. indica ATCC 9039]